MSHDQYYQCISCYDFVSISFFCAGDLEDFGSSSPGGTVSRTGLVRVTNLRPTTATPSSTPSTTNTTTDVTGGGSGAEGTSAESTDNTSTDEITTKVSIIALNELPDGHATTTEFNAWLKDRKSRWAASRAAKRAQRAELARYGSNRNAAGAGGNSGGPLVKKNVGVADFVRNASLAASMGFWQVSVYLCCGFIFFTLTLFVCV